MQQAAYEYNNIFKCHHFRQCVLYFTHHIKKKMIAFLYSPHLVATALFAYPSTCAQLVLSIKFCETIHFLVLCDSHLSVTSNYWRWYLKFRRKKTFAPAAVLPLSILLVSWGEARFSGVGRAPRSSFPPCSSFIRFSFTSLKAMQYDTPTML